MTAQDSNGAEVKVGDILGVPNSKSDWQRKVIGIHPTRAHVVWVETTGGAIPTEATVFDSRAYTLSPPLAWKEGEAYFWWGRDGARDESGKQGHRPSTNRIYVSKVWPDDGVALVYWYEGANLRDIRGDVMPLSERPLWRVVK